MTTVESAISRVNGVVGVAAKHLISGREVRHNANKLFFMASTLKVPLLVELYRQVDRGRIDPDKRIGLTDKQRVAGSGVLRHLASGLQPTIKDLATLMIIVSDNMATDILYEMVCRDDLNRTIQELGLTSTRIPMSTRELLFSLTGMDVDDSLRSYKDVSERLDKGQVLSDADALSEDQSDISTPDDMVRLFELIHHGDILSDSARDSVLDILKRQRLNTIIPYYLPTGVEVAHKTGGYKGVRCDVGIVFAPNGPYAVALMVKEITDPTDMDPRLARVSRAVCDEMNEQSQGFGV